MASTSTLFVLLLVFKRSVGLKTWIQNSGIDNPINWDLGYVPKSCDRIFFPLNSDVTTYWNIRDITLSGLRLPKTGEILFPNNVKLEFRDEVKCSNGKEIKYMRAGVKGWLDGDNWKTEGSNKWVPHSERVPCTGEKIRFPSDNTISVQLPSILLPMNEIFFGDKNFDSVDWNRFLTSELGFKLFKGPEESRDYPWRTDIGCFDKKKCTCMRGAYTVRDGKYKDVDPLIFQEAICLYAMPKCQPANCYSPVLPDGHCCGICGAVLKLEDNTEEGYDLNEIKSRVEAQLLKNELEKEVQTYVGRTNDGNVQIVIVAENSDNTIGSHKLANAIARNLTDRKFQSKLTSNLSGLSFSKYIFNSVSGIVFGTLLSVLFVFALLFYLYVILPDKKLNLNTGKPFVFARFHNAPNEDSFEENLEVGIEQTESESPIQAFDNPIYSENMDIGAAKTKSFNKEDTMESPSTSENNGQERTGSQVYHNIMYENLQKVEKVGVFDGDQSEEKPDSLAEFSEIKL